MSTYLSRLVDCICETIVPCLVPTHLGRFLEHKLILPPNICVYLECCPILFLHPRLIMGPLRKASLLPLSGRGILYLDKYHDICFIWSTNSFSLMSVSRLTKTSNCSTPFSTLCVLETDLWRAWVSTVLIEMLLVKIWNPRPSFHVNDIVHWIIRSFKVPITWLHIKVSHRPNLKLDVW